MDKCHPYRGMEREYVTSQVSLRELCRKHGISAHSLVVGQAKKGKWAEKREQYQAKESSRMTGTSTHSPSMRFLSVRCLHVASAGLLVRASWTRSVLDPQADDRGT